MRDRYVGYLSLNRQLTGDRQTLAGGIASDVERSERNSSSRDASYWNVSHHHPPGHQFSISLSLDDQKVSHGYVITFLLLANLD